VRGRDQQNFFADGRKGKMMRTQPGRLFYVVGASGSGKDSLIAYARTRIEGERQIVFAHRYITRSAEAPGENHVALSAREFQLRRKRGLFALHWEAHGQGYAVGIEIDSWLEKGLDVVVNGSRAYLPRARQRYARIVPVLVTVDVAVLRQRLSDRKRETEAEIALRLQRAQQFPAIDMTAVRVVHNNGTLEQGGQGLLNLLLEE
jgi:ribose 1,5-bisphosphokinase